MEQGGAVDHGHHLADAVAAAALPEHVLMGGVQPELVEAVNGEYWEAELFASLQNTDAQMPGASNENILSWCKPEFKGLTVYFSDDYKPSDVTSWNRLKSALQASAIQQGFSLVSKGSKGKSATDKLRQVLVCGRGRIVPSSRKGGSSTRPTEASECCRFRITIHQDLALDRYYIKGGQNNPVHKFHPKLDVDVDETKGSKKKRARLSSDSLVGAKKAATQSSADVAAASNVVWHHTSLTRSDRWKNHKGAVIWFTGLSASGKSSIANAVEVLLAQRNIKTYLLDGDNLRHGLCAGLGFTAEDRLENLRRTAEVAALMADAGVVVLAAFVSPLESQRATVKNIVADSGAHFVEVYVKANLAVCEARDPKGLYKKARAGTIPNLTGISDPYEEPTRPDVVLEADTTSIQLLADQVNQYLDIHGTLDNDLAVANAAQV